MIDFQVPLEKVVYLKNDDEFLIKTVMDENNKVVFIFYNKLSKQTFFTNDSSIFNYAIEKYHPELFQQLNPNYANNYSQLRAAS